MPSPKDRRLECWSLWGTYQRRNDDCCGRRFFDSARPPTVVINPVMTASSDVITRALHFALVLGWAWIPRATAGVRIARTGHARPVRKSASL